MTLAVVEEAEIVKTADEWADVIRNDLNRAVEGIVSAGRNLIAAKQDVRHGEWLPMLKQIGIGEDQAGRLMRIGRNEALNSANSRNLPSTIFALYELSRLPAEDIEDAIDSGDITPDMTIRDAKDLREKKHPKPTPVPDLPEPPPRPGPGPVNTNFGEVQTVVQRFEKAVDAILRLKPNHEVLEEAKTEAIKDAMKKLRKELKK